MNGVPLAVVLHNGLAGDDALDTLVLARAGWFDAPDATGYTATAARALRSSERDGILHLGSRLAARIEHGVGAFHTRDQRRRWTRAPKPWKRDRKTQYRPVEKSRPL